MQADNRPGPTVFVIFGAAANGRHWVMPTLLQCREDTAVCQVTMVQP